MKKTMIKYLIGLAGICVPWLSAQALVAPQPEKQTYFFTITDGTVTTTPARCPPETCKPETTPLGGFFQATFEGENIYFSNTKLQSTIYFDLPKDPQTDAGGIVNDIAFKFDTKTLSAKGVVDSRAFDGNLVQYQFSAYAERLVTPAPIAKFDPNNFYLARRDFRKCASPMCGGIFIKPVNTKTMRCHDGKRQAECYIGEIKWAAADPFSGLGTDDLALIQGEVNNKVKYGHILITQSFQPKGKLKPTGTFYGVKNNGIVCITSPCPSFDEYTLNDKQITKLTQVDLSRSGATEKEINQAMQMMADGGVVPVVGVNHRVRGLNGTGIALMGSRFYLPVLKFNVDPAPLKCEMGYSDVKGKCLTPGGCNFPYIEMTTIGGQPDPKTGNAITTTSCVKSCDAPANLLKPALCQLALP